MKWLVCAAACLLVLVGSGCRTIGDLNPLVAGTEVGDIKVSPLTGSVTSVFDATGEVDENGKDITRTSQVVKHDRPWIDGFNAMFETPFRGTVAAALVKSAFSPATQKHEVHGKYEVNKRVSGRIFHGYGKGPLTPLYPGGKGNVPQQPGGGPGPGVDD